MMTAYHDWMDLEIKHLQLVAAIARTGSVTRAGDALNLSQSALSHQLRDIENRLAAPLFHRVGKRMMASVTRRSMVPLCSSARSSASSADPAIRIR